MTETGNNPWVERFLPMPDQAEIKRRALLRPTPLKALHLLSTETARAQLNQALKVAFYPTTQCVRILQRWLDTALTHSSANYSGHFDYFSRLHDKPEDITFKRGSLAMCLTGLGGVGKSSLISAAKRVMPPLMKISSRDNLFVTLESCRILPVKVLTNPNDLLRKFTGCDSGSGNDLLDQCRYEAFKHGISSVFADEFQFVSLSAGASATITKMLLALNSLDIPFVYAANFKMLHTLKKRNQQELQRLVGDITEFQPDLPDSHDWHETLAFLKEIYPEKFVFDPVGEAAFIHGLCAGLKRNLKRLLVNACLSAQGKGFVGVEELFKAFKGADYASNRSDVLALQQMTQEMRRKRTDLWNPFQGVDEIDEILRRHGEERQLRFSEASLLAAMSKQERKEHAHTNGQVPGGDAGEKTKRSRTPLTAEELTKNMLQFRDALKK